jgi:hypothetical protein
VPRTNNTAVGLRAHCTKRGESNLIAHRIIEIIVPRQNGDRRTRTRRMFGLGAKVEYYVVAPNGEATKCTLIAEQAGDTVL